MSGQASTSTNGGGSLLAAIRAHSPAVQRQRLLLLGIGCIGAAGLGLSVYYLWKHSRQGRGDQQHIQQQPPQKPLTPLELAERRKAEGIEAFKQRDYEEAIATFQAIIESLGGETEDAKRDGPWRELVASCQNNIAACYDALKNPQKCIEHCTAAIQLKPLYTKALMRRAKCYHQLGQNAEALEEYFDLICLENGDALVPQQMQILQTEMDKVAEAIISPEYEEIVQKRAGQPQKIAQTMVSPWQFNICINDPLLLRTAALADDEETAAANGGLDVALVALKHCKYDEIAQLAVAVADAEQTELQERAQAVLLAARFLRYQGLEEKAKEMADRFGALWERLDEAQKLANKDLHVAHIVLQMELIRPDNMDAAMNESTKQRLAQMAEEALRVNPKNVDALVFLGHILMSCDYPDEALATFQRAKKLDKDHPFLKYYEIYTNFLCALRQEQMGRIHNQIVDMERALKEVERPPVFALLMMTKIGIMMQNNEVALESVKRAMQLMPNCSYAIYLTGMMDQQAEMYSPERFAQYLQRMERAMNKALEADPNNWEPIRMLAKLRMNKQEFDEANRLFDQALALARSKEELMVLLKERLMVRVTQERKRQNKRLPKGMAAL